MIKVWKISRISVNENKKLNRRNYRIKLWVAACEDKGANKTPKGEAQKSPKTKNKRGLCILLHMQIEPQSSPECWTLRSFVLVPIIATLS